MKKNLLLTIALAIAVSVPLTAGPRKLKINFNKTKLEAGKLQVFTQKYKLKDGGDGKRVVGVLLIDAPPSKVWDVLENWDAMGAYVKSLIYYKTVHKKNPITTGGTGISYIEGKLKAAFLTIIYTLEVKFYKSQNYQEWRMVGKKEAAQYRSINIPVKDNSSSVKDIRGFEYIEPYGDGSKTIYYYAPIVEVSMPVPGFVERSISKSSLNEYMLGVKKKVEEKR